MIAERTKRRKRSGEFAIRLKREKKIHAGGKVFILGSDPSNPPLHCLSNERALKQNPHLNRRQRSILFLAGLSGCGNIIFHFFFFWWQRRNGLKKQKKKVREEGDLSEFGIMELHSLTPENCN